MDKKIKKCICIICSFVMLLCCSYTVNASPIIRMYDADIKQVNIQDETAVEICAIASTNVNVDRLKLSIYLQKFDPTTNSWIVIRTLFLDKDNTYDLYQKYTYIVEKNFHYRVRITVNCLYGDIEDAAQYITNSIYVE